MPLLDADKPLSMTPSGIAFWLGINFQLIAIHNASEFKVDGSGAEDVELDFTSAPEHPFKYGNGPDSPPTKGQIESLNVLTDTSGGLTQAYRFTGMALSVPVLFEDLNQGKYG